jgi:hypothetical protein
MIHEITAILILLSILAVFILYAIYSDIKHKKMIGYIKTNLEPFNTFFQFHTGYTTEYHDATSYLVDKKHNLTRISHTALYNLMISTSKSLELGKSELDSILKPYSSNQPKWTPPKKE